MIGSVLGALGASILSVFLITNLFFMGVFSTYIKSYGIDTFYNPFFWDNQNIPLLFFFTALFFVLFFIKQLQKIGVSLLIAGGVIVSSTFIPIVGESAGEWIFYQKSVEITTTNNKKLTVDIIFSDRDYVYLKTKNGEIIKALREKNGASPPS